jgi:hypothetical protein
MHDPTDRTALFSSASPATVAEGSRPNRSGKSAWKWSSIFSAQDKERGRNAPGVVEEGGIDPDPGTPGLAAYAGSIPPSMISLSPSDESSPCYHDDAYTPAPLHYTISASLPPEAAGGAIFISTGEPLAPQHVRAMFHQLICRDRRGLRFATSTTRVSFPGAIRRATHGG